MKKVSILALLLAAGTAYTGSAVLTWTNPTTNTDGSLIPTGAEPEALAHTRAEYFQCNAVGDAWPATPLFVIVPKPATTTTISNLTNGLRYCFRVMAVNNAGIMSAPSVVKDKLPAVGTPNPPVLATIAAEVWDIKQTGHGYALNRQVGTAPLGTPCTSDFTLGGYARVSALDVTFTKKNPGKILVARCA